MTPLKTSKLLDSTAQALAYILFGRLRAQSAQPVKDSYLFVLMHGTAGFREVSIVGIKLFDYLNGVLASTPP